MQTFPYSSCSSPPQGSVSGSSEWVDLRRHRGDTSLRRPGQTASWPVLGPAASAPYRAFRLLLEGPTAGSAAASATAVAAGATGTAKASPAAAAVAFNFCISNLELYGYLHRLEAVVAPALGDGANIAMEEAVSVGTSRTSVEEEPGMEAL